MSPSHGRGPDHDTLIQYITETFPDADTISALGATFFSLDPEKHFPNFATIVTTDEHDVGAPSNLSARPDVYRLNIGVTRQTFERLVGEAGPDPDYAALDRVLPHPVYAKQLWISILNPSAESFETLVKPLLEEAHGRLAATRARHRHGSQAEAVRRDR